MTDPNAIYQINTAALAHWTAPAATQVAHRYLSTRGIPIHALSELWIIGYAGAGRTSLIEYLRAHGHPDALLAAAGLVTHDPDGRVHDRFRHRVMLPIRTADGHIAGFIGRTLRTADHVPKYLNTPATDAFDKGALFYGLAEGMRVGRWRPAILEGPLDALAVTAAAEQRGDHELLPIATSGTALTSKHAATIAILCREHDIQPVIAYDPDPPGQAAALRAGELLRATGLHPHIAVLPAGRDPAEHLAAGGDLLPFQPRPAGTAIPLAAAVTHKIIDDWHARWRPEWPETKLLIARAIRDYLTSYPTRDRPSAAGSAYSVALTRAGIHPDTALAVLDEPAPAHRCDTRAPGR